MKLEAQALGMGRGGVDEQENGGSPPAVRTVLYRQAEEFPGDLAVKDPALPLLWLRSSSGWI